MYLYLIHIFQFLLHERLQDDDEDYDSDREFEEDDGRTIADMSGVERPSLFGFRSSGSGSKKPENGENGSHTEEQTPMTKQQSKSYIGGALLAGLLIAGVFILAGAVAIAVMLAVWTH